MKSTLLGDWLWVPEMKLAFRPVVKEGEDTVTHYTMRGVFEGGMRDVEVKLCDLPDNIQNALKMFNLGG